MRASAAPCGTLQTPLLTPLCALLRLQGKLRVTVNKAMIQKYLAVNLISVVVPLDACE